MADNLIFFSEEFANDLASAGVREVTFSGDEVYGRQQDARSEGNDHPRQGRGKV